MRAKTPVLVAGIVTTLIASAANADFSTASWTLTNSGLSGSAQQFFVGEALTVQAGNPGGTGTFDASTMTLFGGNAGSRGVTWYSTVASSAGTISVNWAYTNPGGDSAGWDGAGWVLNGVFTVLAINSGSPASGTLSFSVNAGDTFGFGAATADGGFGAGTATFTNFVPAPGAFGLLAMAGLAGSRRRR